MNPQFWYERATHDELELIMCALPSLRTELELLDRNPHQKWHSAAWFTWMCCNIKEDKMPRAKKKSQEIESGRTNRPTNKPAWINIKIDDEDVPAIEQYGSNPNDILGELVELSISGADFGIKWADDGKSRMAYIIAPSHDDPPQLVGLSAFAEHPYDAIVALMFKLHVKLGGELHAPSESNRPRFR